MSSKCIKITASRGTGNCIQIHAFRGENCITVTADKPDETELPPLPPPEIAWKFECFDIINHGLNNFIAIGKHTKTLDGTPVSSENIIARFTAIVGLGIEPIPVHDFDEYKVISDITEDCYLNSFNTNSGLDNIAIMYPDGTKVRYFDWTLAQISLITDRHGYVYDAFYETDNTALSTEYIDQIISHTYYTETKREALEVSFIRPCPEANAAALPGLTEIVMPESYECMDQPQGYKYAQTPDPVCYEDSYPYYAFAKWKVIENTWAYPSIDGNNTKLRVYNITTNEEDSLFDTVRNTTQTYTVNIGVTTEPMGTQTKTICQKSISPVPHFDFEKVAHRDSFIFMGNAFIDKQYAIKSGGFGSGDKSEKHEGPFIVADAACDGISFTGRWYGLSPIVGAVYQPSKYIQLNGGDPHKVQTGQDWTAIGSACISTARDFVCENLPTTPSGKTGSVVGDRVVIPIENAEGIKALFSLDQSFIIDEHKIPAITVV